MTGPNLLAGPLCWFSPLRRRWWQRASANGKNSFILINCGEPRGRLSGWKSSLEPTSSVEEQRSRPPRACWLKAWRGCCRPWSNSSSRIERASKLCSSSIRSEEHTSELQSHSDLVCRLLLEKKKET